nr:hypothetical protein SYMBAF_190109 [Serratia symbiotica]
MVGSYRSYPVVTQTVSFYANAPADPFTNARWAQEHDVLLPFDERQAGQFLYLRPWSTAGKLEVKLLQCPDRR